MSRKIESPNKKGIYLTSCIGHYDYCNPEKEQEQFLFHNLPKEFDERFFYAKVGECNVEDGAYEVALTIKQILNKCIYSSLLPKIIEVIKYLEEHEEEQDRLGYMDNAKMAIYQIRFWKEKLAIARDRNKRLIRYYKKQKEEEENG